ncbi:MAG: ATP--guanido phosphotransferase, partial [Planctomycetota bacterium]
ALLTNSRVMGTDEALGLLSHLRLGVHLDRINTTNIRTVNELFLLCQPAHLQRVMSQEMTPAARRIARADLLRQRLAPRG